MVTADPEAGTSVEELLAPLLRADFFLTDGHGVVTRWDARPARAFGREAEDVLGRSAFEAVVSGADQWKRYLAGEGERPDPDVRARALPEGFEVKLLVLPVHLSESLDTSRLLEAIGIDLTPKERLARMQRGHAEALDALVSQAKGAPASSERRAGLVVAYTAPERDTPERDEPAAPAVGEGEERLSRLGELEREVAVLRERTDAAVALAEQALALADHHAHPVAAQRPEREGFDDSNQAKGVIGLDGRFESINPAFEALVGYPEADFRRARWPSLADREQLVTNRALLTRLRTGEIERARVETVYMHGQGLTVPVRGLLELVRSDDGTPRHLLLSVDH